MISIGDSFTMFSDMVITERISTKTYLYNML